MAAHSQKKIWWTKLGLSALVILLLGLWITNLKNVWRITGEQSEAVGSEAAWLAIKNDIDRTMSVARGQLNMVSERKQLQARDGQMFLLQLMTVAQREAFEKATSTAATTTPVIRTDCPQWIDCMPGPDRREPCQVPVGCEKITQIAY